MGPAPNPFDPEAATLRLDIDLGALVENWRKLDGLSGAAECGAAVKADAYGTGLAQAGPALHAAGCRSFFVADANEGAQLRSLLPQARIYVLNGAFDGAMAQLTANNLVPVLNSPEQVAFWRSRAGDAAAALHIDTGMNRLGLSPSQALDLAAQSGFVPEIVISHFACADEPDHPLNRRQIEQFSTVRRSFPKSRASLANSAGIFLGGETAFDLTRPGIALYGGEAVNDRPNPMQPVVTARTRILMTRQAPAGETVSYGGTHTLNRPSRLAICGIGYADGFLRSGSGSGVPLRGAVPQGAMGAIDGHSFPLLGRITMDLVAFDITDLPGNMADEGDWIEIFDSTIPLDDAARAAGTIGYELLTSLGRRYARNYSV